MIKIIKNSMIDPIEIMDKYINDLKGTLKNVGGR